MDQCEKGENDVVTQTMLFGHKKDGFKYHEWYLYEQNETQRLLGEHSIGYKHVTSR